VPWLVIQYQGDIQLSVTSGDTKQDKCKTIELKQIIIKLQKTTDKKHQKSPGFGGTLNL
jgi:hypothetical protein